MKKLIKIVPTYVYWAAELTDEQFIQYSSSEAGADAVKAAGGGSVNRGAKRMYDLMHNLEARV